MNTITPTKGLAAAVTMLVLAPEIDDVLCRVDFDMFEARMRDIENELFLPHELSTLRMRVRDLFNQFNNTPPLLITLGEVIQFNSVRSQASLLNLVTMADKDVVGWRWSAITGLALRAWKRHELATRPVRTLDSVLFP